MAKSRPDWEMTAEMCGEAAAGEEVGNRMVTMRRRRRRGRVSMAARGVAFAVVVVVVPAAEAVGWVARRGEERTRGGGELASSRRL